MLIPSLATFVGFMGKNLKAQIPENFQFFLIFFVVLIAISISLYIAGVIVVGKRRALLSDAFVISLLGTIVLIICLRFFGLEIGIILSLIAWLLLIKRYYETGWLGAIAVGIMSVIVAVVVVSILSILLEISILLFRWLPFLSVF